MGYGSFDTSCSFFVMHVGRLVALCVVVVGIHTVSVVFVKARMSGMGYYTFGYSYLHVSTGGAVCSKDMSSEVGKAARVYPPTKRPLHVHGLVLGFKFSENRIQSYLAVRLGVVDDMFARSRMSVVADSELYVMSILMIYTNKCSHIYNTVAEAMSKFDSCYPSKTVTSSTIILRVI